VDVEAVRAAFNMWLPAPHQEWGKQVFAERLERHPALQSLGAVRGKRVDSRRACFTGIKLQEHCG